MAKSKVISTILTLKDEMSASLKKTEKSIGSMKKEYENAQTSIKKYEKSIEGTQKILDKVRVQEEKVVKQVLKSSTAYQSIEKSIKSYKAKNEEVIKSLEKSKLKILNLEKANLKSKKSYDNAENTLKSLKKAYGDTSDQVNKQQAKVEKLKESYQKSKAAFKSAKDYVKQLKAEYKSNAESIKLNEKNQGKLKDEIIKNNKSIQAAASVVKKYEESLNSTKKSLQGTRDSLKKLVPAIAKTSKAFEKSKAKVKEWGKSLGKTIDNSMKKLAKLGVAAATALAGFGVKVGFETAFDLEAYRTQLDTAVKDTEKASKLMQKAQEFANASPFTSKDTIQSTATMEMYGISSERWLKDVADMAGATNKGMEQATGALVDALSKQEFERLKEFGLSKNLIVDRAKAMYGEFRVFDKGGKFQFGQEEQLKEVIQTLMHEKFDGGAEKLSKTVKGLWSTITGVTSDSLATIFGMKNGIIQSGSALDYLKQQLEVVAAKLVEWQQDGTLKRLTEDFKVFVKKTTESLKSFFNFIKENRKQILFFAKTAAFIYGLAKSFIFLAKTVKAVQTLHTFSKGAMSIAKNAKSVQTGLGFMKTGFVAVKGAVMGMNLAMLPYIAIAAAVAGAAYLIYKNFDKVKEGIAAVWKSIKAFGSKIKEKLSAIWKWLKNLSDKIPNWAKCFMPVLAIVDVFEMLGKAIKKAWQKLKDFFTLKPPKWLSKVKNMFGGEEKKNGNLNKNDDENAANDKLEEFKKKISFTAEHLHEDEGAANRLKEKFSLNTADTSVSNNRGLKQPSLRIPFLSTKNETQNNNVNEVSNHVNNSSSKTVNVTVNITGDVYGFNDFKEKVAKAVNDVVNYNLQNVT